MTIQSYLNCVVQEVLRLRGPIPTTAPRISPGKIIGGEYIPAGVTVSNLPYTTQRDPHRLRRPAHLQPGPMGGVRTPPPDPRDEDHEPAVQLGPAELCGDASRARTVVPDGRGPVSAL